MSHPKRSKKTTLTRLVRSRIIKPRAFPSGPAFSDVGTFSHTLEFSGVGLQTKFWWEMLGNKNEETPIGLRVCYSTFYAVGRSSNGKRITFALPDSKLGELPSLRDGDACKVWLIVPRKLSGGAWGNKVLKFSGRHLGMTVPLWPLPKRADKNSPSRTVIEAPTRGGMRATLARSSSNALKNDIQFRRGIRRR